MTLGMLQEGLCIASMVALMLFVFIPNMVRFVLAVNEKESEYATATSRAVDATFSFISALVSLLVVILLGHIVVTVFPG